MRRVGPPKSPPIHRQIKLIEDNEAVFGGLRVRVSAKSDVKALLMKLDLTQTLVSQMSLGKVLKDGAKYKGWSAASGPNYLVYDGQRDAPPGFALRVGKRSSVCGNIRVGIRVGFHTP